MRFERVTFFRPPEVGRQRSKIPAETYNRCRLLLRRSPNDCCFVPIRSMQYQGVIASDEIIFVDSQGYAVHAGEGGRLIVLAWELPKGQSRISLTAPVGIEVVRYQPVSVDLQRRLLGEFGKAMQLLLERQLEAAQVGDAMRVVAIRGA